MLLKKTTQGNLNKISKKIGVALQSFTSLIDTLVAQIEELYKVKAESVARVDDFETKIDNEIEAQTALVNEAEKAQNIVNNIRRLLGE